MIKKVFFLGILSFFFISCSLDDPNNLDFHYDFMPIIDVSFPDSFEYNEVYNIEYSYYRPTTCHYFYDLYNEIVDDEINVAVVNTVFHESGDNICVDLNEDIVIRSFQFVCTKTQGSYIFNLWIGEDSQGNPIYSTYEIPIE